MLELAVGDEQLDIRGVNRSTLSSAAGKRDLGHEAGQRIRRRGGPGSDDDVVSDSGLGFDIRPVQIVRPTDTCDAEDRLGSNIGSDEFLCERHTREIERFDRHNFISDPLTLYNGQVSAILYPHLWFLIKEFTLIATGF